MDRERPRTAARSVVGFAGRSLPPVVVTGLGAATVAGHLGRWWWPLALIEHGRLQLLWILIVVTGGLVLAGRPWWATGAAVGVALNLAVLAPYWSGGQPSSAETTLTVLHLNTDRGLPSTLDYVERSDDDLVLLQEVTPALAERLDDLDRYRLVIAHPRTNTHGSAVLVRRDWGGQVVAADVVHIPEGSERPLLRTVLVVGDRRVTVLSYHAIRPGGPDNTRYHDRELGDLASWAADHDGELIVVGDFNATPWSAPIRELEAVGLAVSNRGHGLAGTWPATRPALLQLPIDLCLHSSRWVTTSHGVGPGLGGDHRPLHVGLGPAPGP